MWIEFPICVKWWRENNVKNHEIWIEFSIWVWSDEGRKLLRFESDIAIMKLEDWNKYYSLIQIRVLNVVVGLGRKWQRGLKGEKKFKLSSRATKVVQRCK